MGASVGRWRWLRLPRVGRFTGPALRGNLPPQGMLGSLSQPLPSMTRKCEEGVMGVCNPFTSLVLDICSL